MRKTPFMGLPLAPLKYCGVVVLTHDVHKTGVDHGRLNPRMLALQQ